MEYILSSGDFFDTEKLNKAIDQERNDYRNDRKEWDIKIEKAKKECFEEIKARVEKRKIK